MLTVEEAKRIGLNACVQKIGFEFCKQHEDTAFCAYGVEEDVVQCYVGVDDQPAPDYANMRPEDVCLTSTNYAPYFAVCDVNMNDSSITFIDFCIPE